MSQSPYWGILRVPGPCSALSSKLGDRDFYGVDSSLESLSNKLHATRAREQF